MSFARIATVASVTVLFTLAGCDHAPPAPAAEQEPAAAAVPREAATGPPSPPPDLRSAPPASPASPATKPKLQVAADVDAGSGSAGLDRFVAAVQQKLPEVALDRRDEEVEDLGEQACDTLKAGRTATAAASAVADEGVAPADARTLVGLAKDNLCRS